MSIGIRRPSNDRGCPSGILQTERMRELRAQYIKEHEKGSPIQRDEDISLVFSLADCDRNLQHYCRSLSLMLRILAQRLEPNTKDNLYKGWGSIIPGQQQESGDAKLARIHQTVNQDAVGIRKCCD